jgi:two-component system sporulation sensor kinase A
MEASEEKQIIRVSLAESNGQIVLKIADEGCGIPPEIAYRVFDPYFSTKESGTGLGLPITRTIIEKHNGEIAFESGEGKGTTVTVTLPAEEK